MDSSKSIFGHVVFGEPLERNGTTIIPVTRESRFASRTVGVVAIDADGSSKWIPTVDMDRLSKIGLTIALVTGTIATLAVLRQPPWPSQATMVELSRANRPVKPAQ